MTTITHFHLFCGIGGGAMGFQKASPKIPGLHAAYQCLGGVDVEHLTGGHFWVVPWAGSTGAVSGSACYDSGAWTIADPRVFLGDKFHGQYGVATMDQFAHAITGAATHRNGWWTIADPRAQMTGEYGQYGIILDMAGEAL